MLIGGLNRATSKPNAVKPTILTPMDGLSMMGLMSSAQYAVGEGVLSQTDNWALEAVVKPATLPQGPGSILSCGNSGAGFAMNVAGGGDSSGSKFTNLLHMREWVDSGYTFGSAGVAYHVAFVRRSGTTYAYVNGEELAGGHTIASPYTPADYTTVGSERGTGGGMVRQLLGRVRELRVWNIARSAVEIAAVDDQKLSGKEAGLVGYWPGYVSGGKLIALVGPDLVLTGLSSPPTNVGNVIGESITTKKAVWDINEVYKSQNVIRPVPVKMHSMDTLFLSAYYGAQGLSSTRVEGSGSTWASKTDTSRDYCELRGNVSFDLSMAVDVGLWVYVADQDVFNAMYDNPIFLRLGSGDVNTYQAEFPKTGLALNQWCCVRKPKAAFESFGSPPDWSNITWMSIVPYRGPTTSFVFGGEKIFLDFLHYTV